MSKNNEPKWITMRVICISLEDFTGGQATDYTGKYMQVGDEFNVAYECIGYGMNNCAVPCYCFVELLTCKKVFDQRNFAILPDQPENEIEELEPELEEATA